MHARGEAAGQATIPLKRELKYESIEKREGRNMLVYTDQAISRGKKGLKQGLIKPSMLTISVKTKQKKVDQVRIVPRKGFYVVEVVYEKEAEPAPVNPAYYAGIDLGVNNLAALTSNKPVGTMLVSLF